VIDKQHLLITLEKIAKELGKPIPTAADLNSILATFDELALSQSWRERIEISLWDSESNINDATPEYIRNNYPYADLVYTLDIDGQTVYMQAHTPFENGLNPITPKILMKLAQITQTKLQNKMQNLRFLMQFLLILI